MNRNLVRLAKWGLHAAITNITDRKQIERALREIEGRFSAIVRYSPAAIFAKAVTGGSSWSNEALAKLLGRRVEEIVGKTDADFFPQRSAGDLRPTMPLFLASGQSLTLEESCRSAQGNSRC